MNRLDLLTTARAEYRDATSWYRDQNPAVAARFVTEVEAALDSIQRHPSQHLRWDDRYRFCLLRGFPYYVPYRIEGDAIFVVAVFHTSRDSSAWTSR